MTKLTDIIEKLNLTILTDPEFANDKEVELGYSSDMLSCVMAGAKHNSIWVTMQAHLNIIAVATLLELSAIVITEGNTPDQAVIAKANEEGVILLSTAEPTFNIAGRLWELGIRS
jgi:hypothetical protein